MFFCFFRAATRPENDSSSFLFLCSKNEILGCDNLFDLCHLNDRRELWSCTFWESTRTHQCQAVSAPDGRCQNPPRKMHSFSFMIHNSFQMIQTQKSLISWKLFGGLEHFLFSIIYGIILPNWLSYFSRWLKPPTS